MEKTDINELATALSKFQGAIKSVKKNEENPFFKSNYADLAGLWDAIRKPLSDNGLSVIQVPDGLACNDGRMALTTLLTHTSGQYISGTCLINLTKTDPQSIGSALTYYRRYALSAILGLSTDDEDDDGEKAMERDTKKPEQEHWCTTHKTKFFKSGKMKAFAHPIKDENGNDTGEWCHESASNPGEPHKESYIDLNWLKEQLSYIQNKKVAGWSNAEVLKKLNTITKGDYRTPADACQHLTKEHAEKFAKEIQDLIEMM